MEAPVGYEIEFIANPNENDSNSENTRSNGKRSIDVNTSIPASKKAKLENTETLVQVILHSRF